MPHTSEFTGMKEWNSNHSPWFLWNLKSNKKVRHLTNLTNCNYHNIISCYIEGYAGRPRHEILNAQFTFKGKNITKQENHIIQKGIVFKAAPAASEEILIAWEMNDFKIIKRDLDNSQ